MAADDTQRTHGINAMGTRYACTSPNPHRPLPVFEAPADGCRSTSPSPRSTITLYGLRVIQDSCQTIIKRSSTPRIRYQLAELVDWVSFRRHHPAQGFQDPGETAPKRLLRETGWNVNRQHDCTELCHSSG